MQTSKDLTTLSPMQRLMSTGRLFIIFVIMGTFSVGTYSYYQQHQLASQLDEIERQRQEEQKILDALKDILKINENHEDIIKELAEIDTLREKFEPLIMTMIDMRDTAKIKEATHQLLNILQQSTLATKTSITQNNKLLNNAQGILEKLLQIRQTNAPNIKSGMHYFEIKLLSSAYAAEQKIMINSDMREIVLVLIFACLFLTFAACFVILITSQNEKLISWAMDTLKGLIGFATGVGTTFLGLSH